MPISLSSLFLGAVRAAPRTTRGERIYAIGDPHGRLDLFRELMAQIRRDDATRERARTSIIVLGDFVDRGPDSRELIEFIRAQQQHEPRLIALLGNHESLMLDALEGCHASLQLWRRIGGDATLASFEIDPLDLRLDDPASFRAVLTQHIGADIADWLRGLPISYRSGDYFFCHAGVRPGRPIFLQRREDLLWIRTLFLQSESSHGAVVVHGHNVSAEVELRSNRIGVDTGAYQTGILSALGVHGNEQWTFATGGESGDFLPKGKPAAPPNPTAAR